MARFNAWSTSQRLSPQLTIPTSLLIKMRFAALLNSTAALLLVAALAASAQQNNQPTQSNNQPTQPPASSGQSSSAPANVTPTTGLNNTIAGNGTLAGEYQRAVR